MLSPLAIVFAGSLSGISGWCLSFPLDVLKSNIQGTRTLPYRISIGRAIQQQYAKGGISSFYRGIGPTVARAMMVSAVRFSAFELTMRALAKHNNH